MSAELATTGGNMIADLIRHVARAGTSPETLQKLLDVRREYEADEGRKAYNRAISDFQSRAPIIEKGDKAHNKQYARMDRIWRTIRPLFTGLGLSITWQRCEMKDGACHVEGTLAHRDGHSVLIVQDVPVPDGISGQNKAQQMGSAQTYAQRYALCGALGIVTGDDDDGHAAGGGFVTAEQAREIADLLDACRGLPDFKEPVFWGWAGNVEYPSQIAANRYADVVGNLRNKLKKSGA